MTPAQAAAVVPALRPIALRWACSYVDAQDAEDVAQTALELLVEKAAEVRLADVDSWLRGTVWRTAANHRRSARRDRELLVQALPDRPDEAPNPEQTLRSRELGAAVREAMEAIESSKRDILKQVALEERPIAEVAREQNAPESTVRGRLEAAEEELRADLARKRLEEKRKSGSSSWCPIWLAALDPRIAWRRARQAVQAAIRPAAALLAAGALGGAPQIPETLGPTPDAPVAHAMPIDTLRPVTALPAAERGVERVVVRPRARHDVGARMLAERLVHPR